MPSPSLFRGALANLIAKVALVLLGLGITVVVARRGAAVQGAFALFVACEAVMLTLFSGFGLALAREVSHHRSDAARPLSALLLASLGVGVVASVVLLGVAHVIGREPYRHLWLLALGAPFLLMVPTATGLWMGQGRMLPLNLAQVAAPAAVLISLLAMGGWPGAASNAMAVGLTVMGVLTAWVAGKSLVGLASAGWAFHDAGRARPDWTLLGRDARFIVVIGLTNVVSLLNYRVTLFVIEHFKGLSDAGVYSVAMQVGELLWMVSSAVTVSAYHRIGDPDTRVAASMTIRAVRINVLATVACAPVLLALAWWALPWALGHAYFEARWPLAALLPGIAGYAAASSLSAFYTNHLGRPHLSAAVAGLSLTLNVCVSLWAVPRYGALGAAVSTSVAYLIAIVVACGIFLKHAGLGWSAWWRPARIDNTALAPDSPHPGRTHA